MKKPTIQCVLAVTIMLIQDLEKTPHHISIFRAMKLMGISNRETAAVWIKYFNLKRVQKNSFKKMINDLASILHKHMKPRSVSQIEKLLMDYRSKRINKIKKSIKKNSKL